MTPDRKKPTAGFWIIAALVAVLVGYPLSFGPWCWFIVQQAETEDKATESLFYRPLLRAWWYGSGDIRTPIVWYANLASRTKLCAHGDADGTVWVVSIAP